MRRKADPSGRYGLDDWRYDVVPCACVSGNAHVSKRQNILLETASNLTPEMQGMTFAKFVQECEPLAFQAAELFAHYPQGWLLLTGPTGTGKTHLLAAIAQQLIATQHTPLFICAPDFLDFLRDGFDAKNGKATSSTKSRFEQVRNVEILLVDDLGADKATDWATEQWYKLFNYRYSRRMPTVVATNLPIEHFEPRLRSRLKDRALVTTIETDSEDFRESDLRAAQRGA
jgi:DNA replication protein DnaC